MTRELHSLLEKDRSTALQQDCQLDRAAPLTHNQTAPIQGCRAQLTSQEGSLQNAVGYWFKKKKSQTKNIIPEQLTLGKLGVLKLGEVK